MSRATIGTRLDRLEQRYVPEHERRAQIEADAAKFDGRMAGLLAGFTDSDAAADAVTQSRWSPAQRFAWAVRFRPEAVAPMAAEMMAGCSA